MNGKLEYYVCILFFPVWNGFLSTCLSLMYHRGSVMSSRCQIGSQSGALMKDDRFLCGTRHDLYSKHKRNITAALCTAAVPHWSCSEGNAWHLLGIMEIIKWLMDRMCPRSRGSKKGEVEKWLVNFDWSILWKSVIAYFCVRIRGFTCVKAKKTISDNSTGDYTESGTSVQRHFCKYRTTNK